jgi:hypothetical protein
MKEQAQPSGFHFLLRQTQARFNKPDAQLDSAISGTSNNTNAIGTLGLSVSDPPTQSEMQSIANKLDELINGLRR